MPSRIRQVTGCLYVALVAACTDAPSHSPSFSSSSSPSAHPAGEPPRTRSAGAPITLGPGDRLKVTVYGEDRLSGPVTVDSTGHITMPLAGSVNVGGLEPGAAAQGVATRLSSQLKQPRVTVDVLEHRPVYILGEVERAGQYPWRPGLNIVSAMALAGGPTRRASRDRALIQRNGQGPLVAILLSPETPVGPGDLLQIPERFF